MCGQLRRLMVLAVLTGGSAPGRAHNGSIFSADATYESPAGTRTADVSLALAPREESALRYFPLRNYRRFPASVRPLLRRADMEQDYCRGSTSDDPEKYRACNRSWR